MNAFSFPPASLLLALILFVPAPLMAAPAGTPLARSGASAVEAALAPEAPAKASALGAGADTAGGYAGKVLETLLPYWQPPQGASGTVLVALRLSSEGRLLFCETKRGTGNAALDQSPCLAALKPANFGTPPYGAVTEVYLTLATDRAALLAAAQSPPQAADKPAKLSYAEEVMRAVRPHVNVPPQLGGKHSVEVTLRVVEKSGVGGVEQISVSKPSGRGDVDAAILAAACTPGILPAPPEGGASLRLTFTLESN